MKTPNDMNKSNHTELPWVYRRLEDKHLTEIGAGHFEDMWCGFRIGEVFSHSDAALIVHRVNNWDKLVEALEKILQAKSPDGDHAKFATKSDMRDYAAQALKLAKEV